MKQKLLNKLWLRVGMIVAIMTTALSGTVWAEKITDYSNIVSGTQYYIGATTGGTDYYLSVNGSSTSTSIAGTAVTAKANATPFTFAGSGTSWTIQFESGYYLSLKSSKDNGKVQVVESAATFTASNQSGKIRLTIGSYSVQKNNSGTQFGSYGNTQTDIWLEEASTTPAYTITAQSNNNSYGTVSLSGTTITATPEDGYRVSTTTPYTVTSGTATVAQNGNSFGVTASSDCTITINFEAIPTVSGYTIDFESELSLYVDWEMTNIGTSNTAITAHGGSKYGANINDSGNGTATASIQTKEKVAYPNVFTCYVSKVSTNTSTSNWVVEVSSDGSDWTEVATQDAKSMSKGEWVEFTADIKAAGHTNVYVRLYYNGSTAVRAVDDISLTTYTPAAVEEPVISVTSPFTFSTTATITCVTEGATIYYSYDNSTWTEYTEGLSITSTTTIYAKAVKGSDESTVAQVTATKELATPTVEISATSFNIGETATVTTDGPAVTLTTSAAGVASVSGTTVTGVAAGTATITATWAANADYSAGTKEFVVTVTDPNAPGSVNNPYTVAQALAVIDGLEDGAKTDNEVYVAGTVTQIDEVSTQYHNATYWISNDGGTTKLEVYHGKYLNNANFTSSEQIKVNDQVVVYGKLQKYVKNSVVTPEIAADNYIYSLVREKLDPTINVSDASIAYGSTFTISGIEGGDITVTSGNEAIATVEGLVITPVAVGTVTITVETAENATYKAGSETFELTVTAPVGGTEAPTGSAGGTIFEETFVDCTEDGGNDNNFATAGTTEITTANNFTDNDGWSFTKGYPANGCVKFGGSSSKGSATTPALGRAGTLTLSFSAGAWNGNEEHTTLNLSVSEGSISPTSVELTKNEFNTFTATITDATAATTITFEASVASKNRFFLDDVKVEAPASPAPAITATLNGSGYATFCSQYPLDFSGATDYSAWQITGVSGETITFSQITGTVKGGTGILLKGTADKTIELTSVNSNTELSGNLLKGTLAPTYVATGEYYGLSGNQFVKVNAGTVKAGKALLPAGYITESNVKAFTFVFEDDATGIEETLSNSPLKGENIYNLAGQMVNGKSVNGKLPKGIYIVNGKKVLK